VENYSITPGKDKNLLRLGEVDYNVDLSTVPVHSGASHRKMSTTYIVLPVLLAPLIMVSPRQRTIPNIGD